MEFMYTTEAPKGHLPLTNALRGTQLIQVSMHAVRIPDGPGFAAACGCASDMLAAAAQPLGILCMSQCTLCAAASTALAGRFGFSMTLASLELQAIFEHPAFERKGAGGGSSNGAPSWMK